MKKTIYPDGTLVQVGGPAPSWTQSVTNTRNPDGSLSTHSLMKLIAAKKKEEQELWEREQKREKSLRTAKDREIVRERLKAHRNRGKPGAKVKLTDAQVLYARSQIKRQSLVSLAKELEVSVKTLTNAIKGITFKHLDDFCKPQR